MECAAQLAENGIALYTIGCEPGATPYRDFFMALAFKTGGQYVPLNSCAGLSSVIVGSAREEISLDRLLARVHEEVMHEAALRNGPVDETELTRRIHEVMHAGGSLEKESCLGSRRLLFARSCQVRKPIDSPRLSTSGRMGFQQ